MKGLQCTLLVRTSLECSSRHLLSGRFTACSSEPEPVRPDSDSAQNYHSDSAIPVDTNTYVLRGSVVGATESMIRQASPTQGSIDGSAYGGFGYVSGSFTGPIESGKGFVRFEIESVNPATSLGAKGDVVILKTSDTKVAALLPGDNVTFKCRIQYEALAAATNDQKFIAEEVQTLEFDYCRMQTPEITSSE